MTPQSREGLTYAAALLSGAILFFLCFAAIFNGAWRLLLFFLLCYAAAGALGVWAGRVKAVPLALTLVIPAVPWVLWLFPASIPEAGVLRALLWPGLGVGMGGLAWLGGYAVARVRARRETEPGVA
ncbi:MAG TPA: hypothetical protein VFH24_04065 [Gemmatimonadales bacterium]|nr:hypothetical protein [Gemmatimonadales bacterium]